MNNLIKLTKQLVSIPSWVDEYTDEKQIGEFVYAWFRTNTSLNVSKQPVKSGRFNIIAGSNDPDILIVGHMDTVTPRAGWITDPCTPVVKNDRLYGLGSTDMLGSLSAGMIALSEVNSNNVMFLAYCDEEYDFAGMRAFVNEYKDKIKPKYIISLDGSYGQIGIGCRGLIEVSFKLRGKSGHAGRPELGINAITSGINIINKLKRQLAAKYSDPVLGTTTLNLAYCQGGLDLGSGIMGRQGNNIADIAEFVLDIRPAKQDLTASIVESIIKSYLPGTKLKLEDWTVRHDLESWVTDPMLLAPLELPGNYEPSLGYIDTQMLWEAFEQVPCATIGAGNLALAHTPNEYVEISNLEKNKEIIVSLLKGGYND